MERNTNDFNIKESEYYGNIGIHIPFVREMYISTTFFLLMHRIDIVLSLTAKHENKSLGYASPYMQGKLFLQYWCSGHIYEGVPPGIF